MNKLKLLVISRWSLVIIILIIAAFLRLYNITQLPPGLYPDEAMNGNNALEALSTGNFKIFYPENNGREGLFMNIQAIFVALLGNEPWVLRLPSAIFGILTVLGIYFLTKELFKDYRIALLSSFFAATSFWYINFSRIGFRAIMAPFFLAWGIYFLLLALRQIKEQKSPKFYILNSIFSGIFYGLGFYSYIAYRATPLLIFIILLFYWLKNKDQSARKKIILSTCYFLLATIVVAAPLGLYFLQNPQDFFGRTTQISVFNSPTPIKDLGFNILKTAGMFNVVGDWNWRHNYTGRPELFWPVGILFLIGIILGLKMFFEKMFWRPNRHGFAEDEKRGREDIRLSSVEASSGNFLAGEIDRGFRKEYSQAFVIIFSWLIVTTLPVIISNESLPHALRAILMIPAAFILAGVGGIWLYEWATKYEFFTKIRIKIFTKIFIVIFLGLLVFEAYNTYFILWGKNYNTSGAFNADYTKIGYELRALPKDLPKYVLVNAPGVDVRGIPMPAQTVMYITDTFTPEKQEEKNIHYILPNQIDQIPENSYVVVLR